MRKLSKAMAMMGLLAPLGASALGIGDIRLHSGLNQSLNAEIPLVLSGADSLKDVKVSLASPEAFAKAGVEREYFLTKLQFAATQKSDGSYVIRVSSREVMREPFLNFLVEVDWPQGRVLREFTVLLDPPASMSEDSFAETTPPVIESPYRNYPQERVAEIGRSYDTPPVRSPSSRTITAAPRRVTAPRTVPSAPPPTEDQLTNDIYGPVRRGETLWNIATALAREFSVAPEQMVAGLYQANPHAFSGSMDALKAGTNLRIPSREYLAQVSPNRALARTDRAPQTVAAREAEAPQNQLKLLSPDEARLRGATSGNDAGGGEKAKGDLVRELVETFKQENEEFRSRVTKLEQQLQDMQRILTLKDEQIASLQSQQRATAPPAPATTPAVQPSLAPPSAQQSTAASAPPSASVIAEQHPAPPNAPQQPPTQVAPTSPTATKPPEARPAVPPPATVTPSKPATPRPALPPAPVEEPGSFIDSSHLIAGGGALIIGIGAWLIQRRRNAMIAETESILLAAERESMQAAARMPVTRGSDSGLESIAATKSSFLSEFTPSDFDALDAETDDVDPISEADVYLAYGRYKQAEELIRHAISQHPERDDSKLKLLEIYYATENRSAYESYARELKAANKNNQPEFWAKVVEMGQELLPGNSLFQDSGHRPPKSKGRDSASTTSFGALDFSDDLIDDLRKFEVEFVEPASSDEENLFSVPLDFSEEKQTKPTPLSLFDTSEFDTSKAEKPKSPGQESALEFDISSLLDQKPESPPSKPADKPEELENLISFDFGNTPPKPVKDTPSPKAVPSFDDILRDLGGHPETEQPQPGQVAVPEAQPDGRDQASSKLEFDLELFGADTALLESPGLAETEELPATETSEIAALSDDNVYADLTDMDQCETKLDLAKAYADMEDEDSAREILKEVIASGNERQRSEATSLLGKLSQGQAQPELSMPEPDRTGLM